MRRILSFAALLAAAVSCIYPFDAQLPSEVAERLVIDGDIIIGDMTRIKVSYLQPIGSDRVASGGSIASVSVEGDINGVMEGRYAGGSTYEVDTRNAGVSSRFRLNVRLFENGKEYTTGWLKAHEAPSNPTLKYVVDEDDVHVLLSLDGNGEEYYRFDYDETWEFHSDFIPTHMYDFSPEKAKYPLVEIPDDIDPMANYYCWSSFSSREPGLVSSTALDEDRLSGVEVRSISREDRKISVVYYVDVAVRAMSRDGYDYLHTLEVNSNNAGSLFSPVPSDVRGNIRCVADTNEVVIGFIEATKVARCHMYIENGRVNVFRGEYGSQLLLSKPEPDEDGVIDYYQYYLYGYRPVGIYKINDVTDVFWAPARCVDCTAAGGSKTKPAGWPNDHY